MLHDTVQWEHFQVLPDSPCVNKVSKVITGVLTATNEVGWAGLGWGCGISLQAAVMTVDCTGFTEPLPCPGLPCYTPHYKHVCREPGLSRGQLSFIVIKLHWINDEDINPVMIDTGKYWGAQYINHYKHVPIWKQPWKTHKTLER